VGKDDPLGRLNTPTLSFARMGHPAGCAVIALLLLLFGKGAGEVQGCFDELLTERVVAVGLGGGADPAGHAAAAHDGGGDAGDLVGPGFVVLADAQEQAALARSDEQVAVEQPRPSAEHGFFGEAAGAAEAGFYEFF
jgi:hypothetical protein